MPPDTGCRGGEAAARAALRGAGAGVCSAAELTGAPARGVREGRNGGYPSTGIPDQLAADPGRRAR